MSGWALVGLCSTYKEGTLARGAVRSLVECCDELFVFDGPAGEPLGDDVPDTDLGFFEPHRGRWRTDARKRQAMLDHVREQYDGGPVWGVILDGDEVLVNGEYLRDWLQVLQWEEDAGGGPYLGRPIRGVEMNGAVYWLRGRLLRLDRVKKYEVSTSVIVNELGIRHGEGNHDESFQKVWKDRGVFLEGGLLDGEPAYVPVYRDGQVFTGPPMPCEPFILHRPMLRHPLRRGHRLHEQERVELAKAGLIDE